MKKISLLFLIIFLFYRPLVSMDDFSFIRGDFIIDNFMLSLLPGGEFVNSAFENFFPVTTFLIEESNGFSVVDRTKVYFDGKSTLNFDYYFEGFKINSSLYPGVSAVILPLSLDYRYKLSSSNNIKSGINVLLNEQNKSFNRIYFSSVEPNLGSYLSFAPSLLNKHPITRAEKLYETRRQILRNNVITFSKRALKDDSDLYLSLSYINLKRQFNDFSQSLNSTFQENSELFSFLSSYNKKIGKGNMEIVSALNKKFRGNMNSEFGRLPFETVRQNYFSGFLGGKYAKKGLLLSSSFLYEKEKLSPYSSEFEKDLMDNDGEGFLPFERLGDFESLTINTEGEKFFILRDASVLSFFFNARQSFIRGKENPYGRTELYFNKTPLYRIVWNRGSDYNNSNSILAGGLSFGHYFSDNFNIKAHLYYTASSLSYKDHKRNLFLGGIAYDFQAFLFEKKNISFSVFYGGKPHEIRENINFFLENQRPSGIIYGNSGNEIGYTGGEYHNVSENLNTPYERRFMIASTIRLSPAFKINLRGVYAKFSNNLWVKYREYDGIYKKVDSFNLYFQSKPEDYILTNYDFDKDPFYAEFLFNILGMKKKSWFFSFSFMAHMGMGYTAFGNGPVYNDIGFLDENMADPNSWINGYGRVDGDRAFVGKILFGFYPFKNLSMGGNIKYRDGDPFAFINYYINDGRLILYYPHIQAEDERGVKGGPREDCVWDMSFKINYLINIGERKINVFLSFFNLFDIGAELSEYVFTPEKRNAVELQIPRSLRFGISYEF